VPGTLYRKSRNIIWLVFRGVNTEILSDAAVFGRIPTNVAELVCI